MLAIGVGLIVVCVLGQIPAVLLVARYFERDEDDVPPSVRFWQTGDELPPYNDSKGVANPVHLEGEFEERVIERPELDDDQIRCRWCQTVNQDLYRYCRGCQAQLR